MLNWIWLGLILVSVVYAAFTGRMDAVQAAVFESAKSAVALVIGLVGSPSAETSGEAEPDCLAPIAYAFIGLDGSVLSGTPNVSCTFNPNSWSYEITISGEHYWFSDYVTVVTVCGYLPAMIAKTDSQDGKLLVDMYTLDGWWAKANFQFVTYKP